MAGVHPEDTPDLKLLFALTLNVLAPDHVRLIPLLLTLIPITILIVLVLSDFQARRVPLDTCSAQNALSFNAPTHRVSKRLPCYWVHLIDDCVQ